MNNLVAGLAAFGICAIVLVAFGLTAGCTSPSRSTGRPSPPSEAPARSAVAATEPLSVPALPGARTTFWRIEDRDPLPERRAVFVSRAGQRYVFCFVQFPDRRCRAYILARPDYGRPATYLQTHRLYDQWRQLTYVCFEPEPVEPKQLLTVVAHWMYATDTFRTTGTFPLPTWSST